MDEFSQPAPQLEMTGQPVGETPPKGDAVQTGGLFPPPPAQTPWFLRRDVKVGAGVFVALALAAAFIFSIAPLKRSTPRSVVEETYTLVRDKISQSAAIALALPKGVTLTPEEAKEKVAFEPALEGVWAAGRSARELFFEPKEKLTEGNYYTVSLETEDGVLSKDFLVDEDPKILSIFPREGSEAPEQSDITIVFNRPMVPLTTLDTLEKRDIPVVITPPTKGKFNWISTRNLQFIPETRLVRSARYSVEVQEGLVSIDGLPVQGLTQTFTTRPLRYEESVAQNELYPPKGRTAENRNTLYHEPFIIRFNQPVDVERTKREMSVQSNGRDIPFIAEYGTRTLYEDGKEKIYTDKSVLAIYGAADRNGRPRFWDFSASYSVSIQRAFPTEGDIVLDESRVYNFFVPEVIAEITAMSERSRNVSPDLFDPKGKLVVRFYEEIDKGASAINAPHLRDISYGEKCKRNEFGEEVFDTEKCEKEPDKKLLSLSFDPDAFSNSEEIPVTFKKLVNAEGVSLISEPITQTAVTFPKLVVRKTSPDAGAKSAELIGLKLCTNTPLKMPEEKEFYERVKSTIPIGKWNWYGSYRVAMPSPQSPCASGEFETTIRYGLMPESDYQVSLRLEDEFGQTAVKELSFRTGKIPEMYRRISHLQKVYNVTSPERTKLVYGTENLEYVNLHVCQTDALTMLRYTSYETRPPGTTSGERLSCVQSWTKRIELPKRYFTLNYFEFDLKDVVPSPLGHYVLSWGHPDYRKTAYDYKGGRSSVGELFYERTLLTVTNLAVQEKRVEHNEYTTDAYPPLTTKVQTESGGSLYWIARFGTLAPVAGASVNVYRKDGAWVSGGTSDVNGIARTPVAYRAEAAIVTSGNDSSIVASETDKFQWASSLASAVRTYLYTDRPIYRPGEDVFLKGLYRIGYDGDYEIVRDRKAAMTVYDSRGEKVATQEADISAHGTFISKLTLKKDASLGMYRIEALQGYGYFEVEEYKPAAFKVDLSSAKEEYLAGETLGLTVQAAYYFGVPLEKGDTMEYSLLAQDYYFDRYSDGYFQFGKGWYYSGYGGYGDRLLLRGKSALNEKGEATIEQPLDLAKLFKGESGGVGSADRSKLITVQVTVKNKQGESVSSRKSFIVHRGAFYIGVNLAKRYFGKGEGNTILLKTVDTEGKATPIGNIEAKIYKVIWESYRRQEVDGRFYYRSERKRELVKTVSMRTSSSGDDVASFSVSDSGEYELETSATDRGGNRVVSTLDFYVFGEGVVPVRPNNNETLELAVEKNKLKVGETANIIIKSPYTAGKALVTIERGRIFEYRLIDVNQNLVQVSVPIQEAYLPNVFVSVILLSPRPEVKYGQVELNVSAAHKELSVSVMSDKKNYLPGEKVQLLVETRDSSGKAVPAEVSIAVADMSVLALKGNPKKNPVLFFYSGFPLGVSTASNVKNILHEAEVPAGTKGGGGGDEDLAQKKRGDFRSTALWAGMVTTDETGRAEVTFTLPDNLTIWQSEVVGITTDTKVGAGYGEFTARKEVMAVPLRPRFIVAGDTFKLGAKVFNQTREPIRFNVKFESPTLVLPGAKNAFVKINPGESAAVYVDAKAPEAIAEGAHTFVISAEGSGFLDSVEERIPVKKNDTYESVATSFSTSKERAREYVFVPEGVQKDKGTLTISANSTLALYLENALDYLISFPYGCSEQLASRLSGVALLKRAYSAKGEEKKFREMRITYEEQKYTPDELISIGLSRISASQGSDGGFSYYPGMRSNAFLSVHVLNTLLDLREAGYEVEANAIASVSRFIGNEALYTEAYRNNRDFTILAGYALERGAVVTGEGSPLRGLITGLARSSKFVREDSSNLSLAYLALILSGPGYDVSLRDAVMTALENRVTIDGRGAFVKGNGRSYVYDYYETPIKDTALLLQVWVKLHKDHELTDKVLRWLLRSRSKDGSWGSTNNTLSALLALTEYLEWKRESDSAFELGIFFDGVEKQTFTFTPATKEDTAGLTVPIEDIAQEKMHFVDFVKKNLNTLPNTFYYDLLLTYFLPIETVAPRDEGFSIERSLYALDDAMLEHPVSEAKAGQVLRGVLRITSPKERRFVSVEDFIPAGAELVNFRLTTEDQSLRSTTPSGPFGRGVGKSRTRGLLALLPVGSSELPDALYSGSLPPRERLYADAEEMRDDRLFLFRERLPAGVYEYEYFVRALVPGVFHHLPAVVSELYFPEHFGRTRGSYFTVTE